MRRFPMVVICVSAVLLLFSSPCSVHADNHNMLRVAITPVLVERNVEINKKLIEYIGVKIGSPMHIIQRRTYQEVNDLLEQKMVDIAFVCSLPYISGKEQFGMEILVAPVTDGKPYYYSYTIVPKDSTAKSMKDLKGKLYAYPDPLSNSGYLYPRYKLSRDGYLPEQYFKRWVRTYSHTASIEAVNDGLVDGASVDSYIYDLMQIINQKLTANTKIIEISPPFGFPPVVVRKNLSADLKERLRGILTGMDRDEEGAKILKALLLDKFVLPDESLYESVREMYLYMNIKHDRRP